VGVGVGVRLWVCGSAHDLRCVHAWPNCATAILSLRVTACLWLAWRQPMTAQDYRRYIQRKFECEGPLCSRSGEFKCPRDESNGDCYHVEHIIDAFGEEFKELEYYGRDRGGKNIAGNYVMSWGSWNSALGTMSKTRAGFKNQMAEKEEVYGERDGKSRVSRARAIIRKCNRDEL
jgi:hypothetical protein